MYNNYVMKIYDQNKNTLFLQIKYARLISGRLAGFKVKKQHPIVWNMKCPECETGTDSKKARGYILQKGNSLFFYCHHCGISTHFSFFLKKFDPSLYQTYVFEAFREGSEEAPETVETPTVSADNSCLKSLKKISQLAWDHPAKTYIVDRKIPNFFHSQLWYAPMFVSFVNSLIPGKIAEKVKEHARIIIPFFDENKKLFGFSGRSLNRTDIVRYMSIMLNTSKPKFYGLDRVNWKQPVIVVEGPFDSMGIENCIAMAGSDPNEKLLLPKHTIFCYDNEYRSKEIVKKMKTKLSEGYYVTVWPKTFKFKDINDAIVAGMTHKEVQYIINTNSYRELMGEAKLSERLHC